MVEARNSVFERHPKITALVLIAIMGLLCVALAEILLRLFVDYRIDYYVVEQNQHDTVVDFPYGSVPFNSLGYADEEFNLASAKKRVGYFGDSVNFGLGAGYGYRLSELVQDAYPGLEHWNLGAGLASGIPGKEIGDTIKTFKLSYIVHLLNLNDIHPIVGVDNVETTVVFKIRDIVKSTADYFRDKSYLYNFLRFKAKNVVQRLGFEASGYIAYELWPAQNEDVFKLAIGRLNEEIHLARELGVDVCVILLPYEMQISKNAAAVYRTLGFQWEPGFEQGSAQAMIKKFLTPDAQVYDPMPSFDPYDSKVGTYFVFNEGDKIDWNHPNRAGHKRIAEGFMQSGACGFMTEGAVSQVPSN
jgi:hypothetical protein